MKSLRKIMMIFTFASLFLFSGVKLNHIVGDGSTSIVAESVAKEVTLADENLAEFWVKVKEIFNVIRNLIFIMFAFIFLKYIWSKISNKDDNSLKEEDLKKVVWWILLLFMVIGVGELLNFLTGGVDPEMTLDIDKDF